MTSPRISAVAFDLDGLIFDTEQLYFRVANEVMATRGRAFTHEMMRAMIGRQAHVAYPAFAALAKLDEPVEPLLAEIREAFDALLDTAIHPMPGLFALLDRIGHLGLPAAVATSSRRAYAERLLRNHGLWDRFRTLLGAEDVTHSKPDPEIYRSAADRLGVEAASLLVLEDSPTGLAAAKAAGAFAVAIPHEHSPFEGLSAADLVVERLDAPELLAILGG